MNPHTFALIQAIAQDNGFKAEIIKIIRPYGEIENAVKISLTSRKVYAWEVEMMFEAEDAPVTVKSIQSCGRWMVLVS